MLRPYFRKQLVLPAEHGAWAWFFFPFLAGVIATPSFVSPHAGVAQLLVCLAGLSLFLMRQPATVWWRASQGRGNVTNGRLAQGWLLFFSLITGTAALGLWRLERASLFWLAIPAAILLPLYLVAMSRGRLGLRSLGMELAGVTGLALMAPAARIAARGSFDNSDMVLWALFAAQNGLGMLYVRLRLQDTHQKARQTWLTGGAHLLAWLVAGGSVYAGWLPLATLLPFTFWLGRAAWAITTPRPVTDVRRFGFAELGISLVTTLWLGVLGL